MKMQIILALREAEAGLPVKDLCRRHGFSEVAYRCSKFGGMSAPDASGAQGRRRTPAKSCWPSRCSRTTDRWTS